MYFVSAAKPESKAFAYNCSFEYTNRVYTNSVSGTNHLCILVGGYYLYVFDFDTMKKSLYLIKNNLFHACLDPLNEGVSISADPSHFAYSETPEENFNSKNYQYVGSLFYQNDKILFGDAGVKLGVGDGPTIPRDPP